MGNPFYMGNDSISCGWYTPMQTYDLCSGTQWGSMNIQMNANWDDMIARQNLYMTPVYSFNNFMPYGNAFSNNYLLDPMYTLGQADWANKVNGGSGFFDANGNFQLPNFGNVWGGNWGWNPTQGGGNGSGNSSGGKVETAEDRKFQRNYNTLLSLAKQLKDADGLLNSEKDALETAIRNNKGTWKEKYENLKTAYDQIDDKTVITDFLAKAHKLGTSKDIKGKEDANSFYERLQDSGYEYADSLVDGKINAMHEAISKLKDNQGNLEADEILGALQAGKSYDILDVISSWNTRYKDGETDEKRLISYIAKYYNAISDSEIRATAKQKVLNPVVNSLIDKARSVKSGLNEESKKAIDDAITEVTTELNDSTNAVSSGLSEAFDKLYLITRRAAMTQLRNAVKDYYGEIDSEVFNDELFETDTIKDLREEGFDTSAIDSAEVTAVKKRQEKPKEEKVNTDLDKKPLTAQVEELSKESIEKLTVKVKVGDEEYAAYRETKNTGDRDYQRVFIVKEDGIYEVTNAKIENGQIKKVKNDVETELVKRNSSEILNDHNAKVKQEKYAAATAAAEKEEKEKEEKRAEETASKNDKEADGRIVWQKLCEWTTSDDDKLIVSKIKDISKDSIYTFLKGVYGDESEVGCEGLIEKLDDDTSSDVVTMDMKRKIIKSVLEKAEELGLKDDENYKTLKSEFKMYEGSGCFADKTNFNQTKKHCGFLGINWINYNESIDECIFNLYKKMK